MRKISTIAELLVKIGANSSGLSSELNKAQNDIKGAFSPNPINAFNDAVNGAAGNIGGMLSKINGVTALAAGGFGLGAIAEKAINAGESVYQLSTRMGITTAEASNLNRVLRLTGGDSDTFASAMMRLDKNFSASGEAGEKTRGVLEAFGVNLADSSGKLLPLNQQLAELSKGYKLAEQNGVQQEYVMNTLGVRGMALVKTLKDYDEAAQNAAKVQGIGLDASQMHELQQTMKVMELQASQIGLAFTGALAPIAQELFPAIASGLTSVAGVLSGNKAEIVEYTKEILAVIVAYKTMQLAATAGNALQDFWQKAAADAAKSTTAQTSAFVTLSAEQERQISRAVAASNRSYAKMEADAAKAAASMGLSAQETGAIISEECVKIATVAAETANAIRTEMSATFLQMNAEAAKTVVTVSEAFAAQGLAASAAGEKMVVANAAAAESSRGVALAQGEVAAANVVAGNSGAVAGAKMASSLAVAESAAISMSRTLWTLIGGWLGLIAAMGYGAYVAYEKGQKMQQDYTNKYGIQADNNELTDSFHEQTSGNLADKGSADFRHVEDSNKLPPIETTSSKLPPFPGFNFSVPAGGRAGGGSSSGGADKLAKEASRVHEAISKEWVNTTQGKLAQVDAWYDEEIKKLNESASANEHYTDDLQKLNEIYSRKKIKAVYEEEKESNSIRDAAYDSAVELQKKLSKLGLPTVFNSAGGVEASKVAGELNTIQEEYTSAINKIKNKYRDLENTYNAASEQEQQTYQKAWKQNGIEFEIKEKEKVSLKKQSDKEMLASEQEKDQKIRAINKDRASWEESQSSARNSGDISGFIATLSNEQAALAQDLAGRQAYIDEFYATWKEEHKSSLAQMAQAMGDFRSGMTDIFMNLGSEITSAGDFFKSFGELVLKTILKIQAQAAAASITGSLFGNGGWLSGLLGGGGGSAAVSGNTALLQSTNAYSSFGSSAAASFFGFADGGMITGPGTPTSDNIPIWVSAGEGILNANAVKMIGVGGLNALNSGNWPRFATGGLVTGPSLSSLSASSISSSGAASATAGSAAASGSGSPPVTVNVHNYGGANVQTSDLRYDSQSKSYVLSVFIDAMKNNTNARNAIRAVVK